MELQSYVFDFRKSPTFDRKWNKEFDVEDIETNCFNIVLVNDICDDNIEDCLNADNQLRYNEEDMLFIDCHLVYDDTNKDNSFIALAEDCSYTFEENEDFKFKGAFVTNESGYVMGYSINTYSVNITNEIIFKKDLKFWTITEDNGSVIHG